MGVVSEWLRAQGVPGLLLYTIAFAVFAGLALLPTYAQSVLGGFAFGMPLGLPAALTAFTLGAGLGTEIARRATGDRVMQMLAEKPRWLAVRDALVRDRAATLAGERPGGVANFWRTTGMVALIRVPPNAPFALTNLLLASVQVPRAPLWIGTLIGMSPRTAAAVWIGSHLDTLTSKSDLHAATPKWMPIVGIATGVLALVIVSVIANRALKRATGVA